VILPADWHDWDTAKLRAVLAHEFAHVTRRDPLRQVAASVFRAVVWFHPLAWWLRSHLAELSELASDDVAVSALGDRVFYAETLLEFIERAQGRVRLEGVAMASPRTRARRLARLLDENHCPSRVPVAPVGWVITAVLLALMCVAAVVRPQRLQAQSLVLTPPAVAAAPQVALPGAEAKPTAVLCGGVGAYRKWLDEDAVYIVTRDERREYLALQTERDCQTFISQFWQRRPAGMKIEHYRRIAYANERLAASAPGWRTDRGRTYIVYGPPDEIESHLTAGRTYPFEVWRYRSIDGLGEDVRFEFVDSKQNGEYPLLAVRDAAAMALLRMPPGSGPAQAVPRVAMLLLSPRVDVDGTDFGSAGVPALSGHEVYVATRGAGAFILSLEPGAGLTQIGTATGRRIEVEVGGHAMRIDCSADVSPTGTAPVYGRFDRSYRPTKDLEVGSGTPR
jgi:GWxTD domain-containing protein